MSVIQSNITNEWIYVWCTMQYMLAFITAMHGDTEVHIDNVEIVQERFGSGG